MPLPSRTDPDFWRMYRHLPPEVRKAAQKVYRLWLADPRLSGLRFKHIGQDIYSIRINDDYRALAMSYEDGFLWFWIGTHAEYDRFLKSL